MTPVTAATSQWREVWIRSAPMSRKQHEVVTFLGATRDGDEAIVWFSETERGVIYQLMVVIVPFDQLYDHHHMDVKGPQND